MPTGEHDASTAMRALLVDMVAEGASDVHLVPGHRPTVRVHGSLRPTLHEPTAAIMVEEMLYSVVPTALRERFRQELNLDFSVEVSDDDGRTHRFRGNTFRAQGHYCGCLRHIPERIPSFEWMSFPKHVAEEIARLTNGLVIVTGITGSGKSTTLAGIVDLLNRRGGYRIITVEQPIEYLYERTERTVITQREVGVDCASFLDGLKYGLRQDPDVILVGEIRDRETAQMALSAAETGHLILTTMHTKDAKGAVSRFVDLFDVVAHDDIRAQLAFNLRYVIAQHLLPHIDPVEKRALALETMKVNNPVRAGIKLGKLETIESAIQTGRADGMIRLDDSIQALLRMGKISLDTARRYAKNPDAKRRSNHAASRPHARRRPAHLRALRLHRRVSGQRRCPECGNAVNTVPQRTAPAFVLLLCLTLANAGMAVTAYWEYPKTLSAWRGTNKPAQFLLCGWILLAVSWHRSSLDDQRHARCVLLLYCFADVDLAFLFALSRSCI
jgi:twitching motility protein PilT